MSCPHHGRVRGEADELCWLQQLADHTITVTTARAPRVAVFVLLLDLEDRSHSAAGSDIPPEHAAALLEEQARKIRAALARA